MKNQMKLDANESIFFARQLEHVKARTYDVIRKTLKATMLIPVETDAPAGADVITFRSFDAVGIAKIIADYGQDFPRADVHGREEMVKVYSVGSSYGYNIKEIRRAQMANVPLSLKKAAAAKRAIDELIDKLAWRGDADYNIQGFINYPGISEFATGTGSWAGATPDQIVADLAGIVTMVVSTTNGGESPDTMIMPIDQFELISNKRMTDGDSKTVMTFFLDNNPHISTIDWLTELKGAGAGGVDRMMVYTKDTEKLGLQLPQPFEQFDADKTGMEFEIPCHAETAGVIVYYPLSVAFQDGI